MLRSTGNRYPVGRNEWRIFGDELLCYNDKDATSVIVNLTLTTCVDGQFTCNNGHCVDVDKVCISYIFLHIRRCAADLIVRISSKSKITSQNWMEDVHKFKKKFTFCMKT